MSEEKEDGAGELLQEESDSSVTSICQTNENTIITHVQ